MKLATGIHSPDKWTQVGKTAFLFFFIFLGTTSIVGYNMIAEIFDVSFEKESKWFSFLRWPLGWLDRHIYHIGLKPATDFTYFGDSRFGYALLTTIFIVSVTGAFIWSWLDRKRPGYDRLFYWFRVYLANYLFLAMLIYAFEKIIPTQMAFPNAEALFTRLGDKVGFNLVWDFIGSRPTYSIFTGICELAASILVIVPRTRVLGCLVMTAVLANVVCFNIFYNVPVKILSIQLLTISLFLLTPFFKRLMRLFFFQQPVSVTEKTYRFSTPWKKYMLGALLFIIPVWVSFLTLNKTLKFQKDIAARAREQQVFDISRFVMEKDTLSPLLSDTVRWRRLFFTHYRRDKYAVIFYMNEDRDYYGYTWDSTKKIITFTPEDTTKKVVFHYSAPTKNKLDMEGKWINGHNLHMVLDRIPIDSMPLIREKIKWIQQ